MAAAGSGVGSGVAARDLGDAATEAAAAGDVAALKALIAEHGEGAVVSAADGDGSTALHWAAFKDQLLACRALVDAGAGVDVGNEVEGHTPLMWAAVAGHLRVVHYLVEHAGASLAKRDRRGYSALHHAAQQNKVLTLHYVHAKGGLDIDERDTAGHTPLMWAAYRNHDESARYLIQRGADINAVDLAGNSSLMWAATKGNLRVVKTLLAAGADTALQDRTQNKETALAMAQRKGFTNVGRAIAAHVREQKGAIVDPASLSVSQRQKLCFAAAWIASGAAFFPQAVAPHPLLGFALSAGIIMVMRYFLRPLWIGDTDRNPFFAGFTLSAYVYGTVLYFMYCFPDTSSMYPGITMFFACTNFIFFPVWCRLILKEPGWVTPERVQKAERGGNAPSVEDSFAGAGASAAGSLSPEELAEWTAFLDALDAGRKDMTFCVSCSVRRPLRSKHCKTCHKCVARFDHHCMWINQCVGVENLAPFMLDLMLVIINHATFVFLSLAGLMAVEEAPNDGHLLPINKSLPFLFSYAPVWSAMLLFHIANMWWQSYLLYQMFQNLFNNVTMNERINGARYAYLHDAQGNYRNPFYRGYIANFLDFVAPKDNWYAVFSVGDLKK